MMMMMTRMLLWMILIRHVVVVVVAVHGCIGGYLEIINGTIGMIQKRSSCIIIMIHH
jgi:hypothetical protein